jgi:hypothetical protein
MVQDRRTLPPATDDKWMDALPVWAQSFVVMARVIAVIGAPTAIAIFLVWSGAKELPELRKQSQLTYEASLTNREILREHALQSAAIYRLLQRICSNGAKTDTDRQRCFDE